MVRLCSRLKIHYAWVILTGCFLLSCSGTTILVNSVGIFIKPVSTAMGFSRASFALFYTFSTLVATVMAPTTGLLLKRFGTKPMVMICTVGAAVTMFSYSFCQKLYQFYICGCIAGLFTGALMTMGISGLIYRWFAKKKALAIGIAFSGSGFGTMLLNPVLSRTIETAGWQTAFRLLGVLLLVCNLLGVLIFVIDRPEQIGLLPYGAEAGIEKDSGAAERSICQKEALKMAPFWTLCAASAMAGFIGTGIQQHIQAYFTDIGYTADYSAYVFSGVMLIPVAGKLILGGFIDKLGIRTGTTIICLLLSFSAFVLLAGRLPWMPWAFIPLFGGGYAILSILPTNLTRTLLGAADYSANYGVVTLFLNAGMASGSPFSAFVFDSAGSYKPAWIIYGVLSLIMLATYHWAIRKFRQYG